MNIVTEKKTLRAAMRARREKLAAARPDHAARLAAHADAIDIADGTAVSGFLAMAGEVDPMPLMLRLADRGAELCVPRVAAKASPLVFHRFGPDTKIVVSGFGVREPDPETDVLVPDLLLVPLLAFDKDGYRIGYGGGFYDRTLADLRAKKTIRTIGVAYDGQELDKLPHDDFDERLDMILTETGLRRFDAGR